MLVLAMTMAFGTIDEMLDALQRTGNLPAAVAVVATGRAYGAVRRAITRHRA